MQYNWDWGILFRDPYIWWLVDGLKWTLMIAMCAWVLAFVLGSALGIMRTSINPYLRLIGTTYVEIFRNIPLLVQLFLWYFVFPELLPEEAGAGGEARNALTRVYYHGLGLGLVYSV